MNTKYYFLASVLILFDIFAASFSIYLALEPTTFWAGISVAIPWIIVNLVVVYECIQPTHAGLNSPSSVSSVTSDDTGTTLPSGNL